MWDSTVRAETLTLEQFMELTGQLGDVMKAENATFGISFCGSGGAGAITAQTKYGYKAKYGMRSVDAGVTAINEGCNVLGFGFMDKEELGERLVQAWNKKHGS